MEVMDLSPRGIREHLGLNKPIYARTSAYGHFGRAPDADGGFSWEKTDLVDTLQGPRSADSGATMSEAADRDRRLLRPPQGQDAARRPGRASSETLLPRLRVDRRAARSPAPSSVRAASRRSGSRSASAAASICLAQARAHPRHRLHRLRALRQRHGQAAGRRSSREALDNIRVCDDDAADCCRRLPAASPRPGLSCSIPIPGRSAASASAASSPTSMLAALARVMRPGRRAALRHRYRRLRRLDARARPALAPISAGRRERPTTGASPMGRLARHPLRGQGPREPAACRAICTFTRV